MLLRGLAILVGLFIAAFAAFLSFFMAGAGEGWVAPMSYSMVLAFAYPFVLFRLVDWRRSLLVVDVPVLALAIALDIYLILGTYYHEYSYFLKVLDFVGTYIWIGLWLLWQFGVLLLVTIDIRRRRGIGGTSASSG